MPADRLLIPYGGRRWPVGRLDRARPDPELGPLLEIDRASPAALRLGNFPYVFAEPPEFGALTTTQARLDFLREHFKSYWGIWDRLPLAFLDAYFAHVAATVDAAAEPLAALAAPHGGLFRPADWSFAAPAPAPIAHLGVSATQWVCVDFAFWTGTRLIALDIVGSDERGRRDGRERLRAAGIAVIEFPGAALRGSAPSMGELLPPEFSDFWRGVALPSSPFRIGSLVSS